MSKAWTWIAPHVLYLGHLGRAHGQPLAEQPGIGPICIGSESAPRWASRGSIG